MGCFTGEILTLTWNRTSYGLPTSFPEDYDCWTAFLRDTEQQPSAALDLKPHRESLLRSLNKMTSTFQAFSTTPFFASLRGPTGDDVTTAETDVMYPRSLDNLLLSGKGLQSRYAQMFRQVNLFAFRGTLPTSLLARANGLATPHAPDFLLMHPQSRLYTLQDSDMKFAARAILYILPTNEHNLQESAIMNTTEGPKDAYAAFRKLFRSAHAWPRHDRLTNTFVHLIRKSGFRVLANAPTPNAGARSEVDFLVCRLTDIKDVAFDVSVAVSDSTQVSSQNAASAGTAANLRAQYKREKYEELPRGWLRLQPAYLRGHWLHSQICSCLGASPLYV